MIQVIRHKIEEETVFIIATILAVLTSFFVKPDFHAVDMQVIAALWNLMLISLAFERYHLLDKIAIFILNKVHTKRMIGVVMILATAILAMVMTNDVSLLTIVPITIAIGRKGHFNPFKLIVLETAAANIGSSLTPFGNPQNLFLFHYYHMDPVHFLITIAPFTVIGLILLLIYNQNIGNEKTQITFHEVHLKHRAKLSYYVLLFLLTIASILRLFDYRAITILVFCSVLFLDRKLIKKADYFLIGTFVSFFIFIDNVTRIEAIYDWIHQLLSHPIRTYISSSLLSQVISNVPTAILVSGFTEHESALVIGVSVGGLGTLIASLANLISYKLYVKAYGKGHYFRFFTKVNVSLFLILFLLMIPFI